MRGETYDATAGYRSKFSRVLRFSPADEKGETECYNPLDFVAIDPDQRDIDINAIAAALLPTPKGDTYWVFDARALLAGRFHVAPEDIRALVHPTFRHRILLGYRAEADGVTVDALIDRLIEHLKM